MSENVPDPISDLIERYFLDPNSLSDTEQATLIEALKADPAVRRRFRMAAHIETELRYEASGEEPVATTPSPSTGTSWPKLVFAIAATLLIGIAIGYSIWPGDSNAPPEIAVETPDPPEPVQPEAVEPEVLTPPNVIARLDVGHAYRFEEGFAPKEGEFLPGDYHLAEGEITLGFDNGVAVSVESPARFKVVDPLHMHLEHGRARAIVPETGHGFVIQTSKLVVEDLGTEFGVVVDDQQNQELHVFAGEVRLHEQDLPPELLTENSALAWNAQDQRRTIAADDHAFATSMSIGYKRWLDYSERLRDDPAALFYFDFETDSRESNNVTNRAEHSVVQDGHLNSGIWATGRWPEKGAMLFENPGDRIELDIPGEYDQITMMAWVQMNRYDLALQTVFNTIGFERGEHHWNLLRSGSLRMGLGGMYDFTSRATLPRNRWTHVAAQLDSIAKQSIYYIDGKEVGRVAWDSTIPLRYGPCSIGAWGFENNQGEVVYGRELRGRIDEIALFSRILSVDEIAEAYEAGSNFQ